MDDLDLQAAAAAHGVPSSSFSLTLGKDPGGRVAHCVFEGTTLTVRGPHKKDLRRKAAALLTALLSLHSPAAVPDANEVAAEKGHCLPEVRMQRTDDGSRAGGCTFLGIDVHVTAPHKAEAKGKLNAALVAVLRCATDDTPSSSPPEGSSPTGVEAGANDWSRANLGDQNRNTKFLALMGATKATGAKRTQQQVTTAPCDHETSEETETKEKPHKTKRRKEDPSEDVETKIVETAKPDLPKMMAGWFVPPATDAAAIPKAHAQVARRHFVVLPGSAPVPKAATAVDAETSEKIARDLQKGYNKAMQIRSLGVAGLGFQHYTHEQFANNAIQGTKVVFD